MATADRAALGFCQGISMGSETSNTQKRYSSPLPQNKFSIYVELLFLCTARRCLALPGPAWPSPALHDPPRPCLALPGPTWTSHDLNCPLRLCLASPGPAWPSPAMPCPALPGPALPGPSLSLPGPTLPCLVLPCPALTGPETELDKFMPFSPISYPRGDRGTIKNDDRPYMSTILNKWKKEKKGSNIWTLLYLIVGFYRTIYY